MLSEEQQKERDRCLAKLKITTYKDKNSKGKNLGYVFISYKSDDWKKVFEEKVFMLQNECHMRIYSDKQFDDSNHPWLDNMEKNIKHSSAVILFISENYLKSYATFIELLSAIKYDREIVPVYISENSEECFRKLKGNYDLEDDIIKMNATEADQLKSLMCNNSNAHFQNELDNIRNSYLKKVETNKFSVMNLVEAFEKILKESGKLQDNYFSKPISTLRNTILEIVQKGYSDVFEDEADVAENADENVVENVPETAEVPLPDDTSDNAVETNASNRLSSITYSIYGRKYTDNQSDMMLNVFAKVLQKHPDIVDSLESYKGMNCVSKVNYEDPANRTGNMPPYFRTCRYFEIGSGISVGTSYGIDYKIRKIAALIDICGEDRDIFQSEDIQLPTKKNPMVKTGRTGRTKPKRDFLAD